MNVQWCDWCDKPVIFSDDPHHFDREGFCSIQWNIQAHYGDAVNKHVKENPTQADTEKYTIPKWGE